MNAPVSTSMKPGMTVPHSEYALGGKPLPFDPTRGGSLATCDVPGRGNVGRYRRPDHCPECGGRLDDFISADRAWTRKATCDRCQALASGATEKRLPIIDQSALVMKEFADFHSHFPMLAGILGKQVKAAVDKLTIADGPFPLGDKSYAVFETGPRHLADDRAHHPVTMVHWQAALARHAAGDFGVFGRLANATAVDPLFAELFDVATRNATAVAEKAGAIRSRYPFSEVAPEIPADLCGHHVHRDIGCDAPTLITAVIDVCTVLNQSQAVTRCRVSNSGLSCFGV